MLKTSSVFDSVGTVRAGRIYVPSLMVGDNEFGKIFTLGDEVEIELRPELGGLLVTPKNETTTASGKGASGQRAVSLSERISHVLDYFTYG